MSLETSPPSSSLLLGAEILRILEFDALPNFLPRQRWFAGKSRRLSSARIVDSTSSQDIAGGSLITIVRVEYDFGHPDTYFLPLGVATGPAADLIEKDNASKIIASIPGVGVVHDALSDSTFCLALLDAIAHSKTVSTALGTVRGLATSVLTDAMGRDFESLSVRRGSFEQSNSAILFGDRLILKIFRRLDPGINPDFEIGRFLAEKTTFNRIPRMAGALSYDQPGSEPFMLGILQNLVVNEGSGWDHAQIELASYYRRVDGNSIQDKLSEIENKSPLELSMIEPPKDIQEAIGSYLIDAGKLGRRTAELHLALASDSSDLAFAPEPISSLDLSELSNKVMNQVNTTLAVLQVNLEKLIGTTKAQAIYVLERSSKLIGAAGLLKGQDLKAAKTRVHGDYHLGQILRTGDDFVILDFEGEPAKPLAERVAKVSPLKDVVGMIRSFDYAAFTALFAFIDEDSGRFDRHIASALIWRSWVSARFLMEYLSTARDAAFIPMEFQQIANLLKAFTIDKALYELLYELNNRPTWVRIPLQGISAIIGPEVKQKPTLSMSELGDLDVYLLGEGTHYQAYNKLGAHPTTQNNEDGCHFAVWAPNALNVSVIGPFNQWKAGFNPLRLRSNSGVWEGFIPGAIAGHSYKYAIESRYGDYRVDKADPYAFAAEPRPQTASIITDLEQYQWDDAAWLAQRADYNFAEIPLSIYEVHLGSWVRKPDGCWLGYREIAPKLADYVNKMGFTHVEFMPLAEHPFDGSWGYQVTGYFAPTSRFGSPHDFMFLVDYLHQQEIGIILDWVPAHFPTDEHALGYFDGTHLYEHSDPRLGFHPDWNTFIFNFGRPEVSNFLISNALFWLDKYHIDGLRVDAVASMLYLDYSRKPGEWIPNENGGRENLEAISLLKRFNEQVHVQFPGVITIAEESTSWPMVSHPTAVGGLGFDFKWDMGWMHDTLDYFIKDPIFRKYEHNRLTFRGLYAYSEKFILPLSHDEVVYGKGSLLRKMPGDAWQKFAGLRLMLGYQFAMPGKKLVFMGDEFGQWEEWNHDESLHWHLLTEPEHEGIRQWVRDLNTFYCDNPALHELDMSQEGFTWVDADDADRSVLSFLRVGKATGQMILIVANFTPIPRQNYRVGVPQSGYWEEFLNSDAAFYGGSGVGNVGGVFTTPVRSHHNEQSLNLTIPPLALIAFRSP